MKVTYIFHSCFIVELAYHILIFDYYKGNLPAFDPHKKIIFFVSHQHNDHYTSKIWTYHKQYPDISYIIEKAVPMPEHVDGLQVRQSHDYAFQDMVIQTLTSTDEGVAFLVHLEGKLIYHAGDLNWWHWKGEPDQDNAWHEQAFHQEIKKIKHKHINVAFAPLDPRQEENAWWGFADLLKTAAIDHIFPMHFAKDIKKMQAYLDIEELAPYQKQIMKIDHEEQVFSFK